MIYLVCILEKSIIFEQIILKSIYPIESIVTSNRAINSLPFAFLSFLEERYVFNDKPYSRYLNSSVFLLMNCMRFL